MTFLDFSFSTSKYMCFKVFIRPTTLVIIAMVFLDQEVQIAFLRAQNKAVAANMARANWV